MVELVVDGRLEFVWGKVESYPLPERKEKWLVDFKGEGAVAVWVGGGYRIYMADRQGRVKEIVDRKLLIKV